MKRYPTVESQRDPFLESVKGMLILLVVIGHLVSSTDAIDDQFGWYRNIRTVIYSFHMPLFMLLSGMTFKLSQKNFAQESFLSFVIRRGDRLIIPFFVVGLLLYISKFLVSNLGSTVPNFEVSDFFDGITRLFVDTSRSPVRSIWFIFTLFWITILTMAAVRLGRPFVFALLVFGILLYVIWLFQIFSIPYVFFLDRIFRYLHYFVLGYIFCHMLLNLSFNISLFSICSTVVVLIIGMLIILGPNKISITFMPIAVALLLFQLSSYVSQPFLAWVGQYTFIIYLLNTLFIGATLLVFSKTFPDINQQAGLFAIYLLIATLIGTGGPIILRVFLLDQVPILKKYVA